MEQNKDPQAAPSAGGTSPGVVHVLPKAYQGGKMPLGSSKTPVSPLPPKAPPKAPPPVMPKPVAPASPRTPANASSHRKRVRLLVGGIGFLTVVAAVLIVLLVVPKPENTPSPANPPVVTVPTPERSPPKETPREPEPVEDPALFVKEHIPGRDVDSDGLTDVEELLFGSSARLPDTDGDGFLDSNEVFHGYDPSLPAPATLLDSGRLTAASGEAFALLVPSSWRVRSESSTVTVVAGTGEVMRFEAFPVLPDTSMEGAVLERLGENVPFSSLDVSKTRLGFPLAVTDDHRRSFVLLEDVLVEARYDLDAEKTSIEYLQTFQTIVQSITPRAL